MGVKFSRHAPPSIAEVQNAQSFIRTPSKHLWHGSTGSCASNYVSLYHIHIALDVTVNNLVLYYFQLAYLYSNVDYDASQFRPTFSASVLICSKSLRYSETRELHNCH
jgi:hypothetical protein